MKPAQLVLIAVAVLGGLGLWTGRKSSPVAYKDPLDTNEFPLRFTDPIRVPTNSASVDTPPLPPPRPRGMPALREPWQTNALNEAIHWLLTEGFKHYSTTPFTGIVHFHPHELPTGFVPAVSGFSFMALPWPHHGRTLNPNEVNLHIVMNGVWTDTTGTKHPMAGGIAGEQVAIFPLVLNGHAGMAIVDMNASFGVFKTTNGYVTKNLGWIDP